MTPILTMLVLRPYVFGFLVAFLFLAVRIWGWRRTLLWMGMGYAIAWASEAASIRTGFPYGWYFYKYENLTRDILLAGVPIWDSLSYTFLIFAGYTVVQYRWPALSPAATAMVGGAATMLLDIMIDPVSNLGERWFLGSIYYYPTGGWHFGVPITNYIGWFFVSWVIISVFQRTTKQKSSTDVNWLYPAFYIIIGIFNTAIAFWISAPAIGIANTIILCSVGIVLFTKPRALFVALLAFSLCPSSADASSRFISEYTSLTNCQTIPGTGDFAQAKCPGREGFTVYNEAGDIYGWLRLQNKRTEIKLWGVGMDELIGPVVKGAKLEWRYLITDAGRTLIALIYRVTGNDRKAYEAGNSDKFSEYLYVIKLKGDGFCTLGHVTTNEEARQLADSGKSC